MGSELANRREPKIIFYRDPNPLSKALTYRWYPTVLSDSYTAFSVKSCIIILMCYVILGRSNAGGWDAWQIRHARIRIHTKFWQEVLKDRRYVGKSMWNGFVWLMVVAGEGFL